MGALRLGRTGRGNRGITLTEVLVALAVLGVFLSVFYSVFIVNWFAFDERIHRADLLHETNRIIELISVDGRNAATIDFNTLANKKEIVLKDSLDEIIASYSMLDTGQVQYDSAGDGQGIVVLSKNLDFSKSQFAQVSLGKSFVVSLALEEQLFTRKISTNTSVEIFQRN